MQPVSARRNASLAVVVRLDVSVTPVDLIQNFAALPVCVRLADGTAFSGHLRTELLSERSVSVFIRGHDGGGVTLYIDQIVEIVLDDQLRS